MAWHGYNSVRTTSSRLAARRVAILECSLVRIALVSGVSLAFLAGCGAADDEPTTTTRRDSGRVSRDSAVAPLLDGGTSAPLDSAMVATSDSGIPSATDSGLTPAPDGSVTAPAADSSVDAATPVDSGPPGLPPLCITQGSQVVALGDSYVQYRGPATDLTPLISALARADGVLESTDTFRNHAFPGASIAGFGLDSIPDQIPRAIAADPDIRAVFMTGGGNDVLIGAPECTQPGSAMSDRCQQVVADAIAGAREMLQASADAGIRDVVYFFYPEILPNGLISGPAPNEILSYAYPYAQDVCESAFEETQGRTRCHFIDLRPVFEGRTAEWINALDGVHPEAAGAEAIAETVWHVMKDNCIGQLASSGCCAAE